MLVMLVAGSTAVITSIACYYGTLTISKRVTDIRLKDVSQLLRDQVDAEEVARIRSLEQQASPSFRRIHDQLADVIKKVDGVRYIYIFRRAQGGAGNKEARYLMAVDGTPYGPDFQSTGEILESQNKTLAMHRVWQTGNFEVERELITDRFGTQVSAYIPLRRRDGSFEAVLGIDIDHSEIEKQRWQFLRLLAGGQALSLILVIPLTALVGTRLSRPIRQISQEHLAISKLDFDHGEGQQLPIDGRWIQEIHEISESLELMNGALRGFNRYVPTELVRKLLFEGKPVALAGENRKLAIMFSDIVDFTRLTETLAPQETLDLLNQYFTAIQQAIRQTHGIIDKYIGDATLVFWGAPDQIETPARQCVEGVLSAIDNLRQLNARWRNEGVAIQFETCFGIDFGEVTVGNMGAPDRMNYTIVGDRVNLCSRLEHENRHYGTTILATRPLVDELGTSAADYLILKVDNCQLRGFSRSVEIFEILGHRSSASLEEQDYVRILNVAWSAHEGGRNQDAISALNELPESFRSTRVVENLLTQLSTAL